MNISQVDETLKLRLSENIYIYSLNVYSIVLLNNIMQLQLIFRHKLIK